MSQTETNIIPPNKLSNYRPDIDGLRAIAVLAVLVFHAFPDALPGGFAGVDVFFVISGFLISGIIFRQLDEGRFSYAEFYSKRIRRIFPSLLLVLLFCYTVGWFLLFKNEFIQLSKHILGGAGFASNFILWQEAGYFDVSADVKPLLHLWSLGVEEQFYIVFPLLFAWIFRKGWNRIKVLGVLFLLSFSLNAALYKAYPTATFYAPWTRFWEILAGSVLVCLVPRFEAFFKGPKAANFVSILGIAAMLASFALMDKDSPFPGWIALLPVTASFLLIAAGMKSAFNRQVLAQPLMQWIGKISYPLYLWHWPLLVFARIGKSESPSVSYRIGILLLSVFLAWMTYLWVENRLRFGALNRKKVAFLSYAMLFLALVGFATMRMVGVPSREINSLNFQSAFQNVNSKIEFVENGCGLPNPADVVRFHRCQHDSRQTPRIALLGDSKAQSLSYGLFRKSDPDSRVLFIGGTGEYNPPLPLLTDAEAYKVNQPQIKIALDALTQNPDIKVVVITAGIRSLYGLKSRVDIEELPSNPNHDLVREGLSAVLQRLVTMGKKVVMTTDNPTLPRPEDCISRKSPLALLNWVFQVKDKICSIPYEKQIQLAAPYLETLRAMETRFAGEVAVFDTLPLLCDMGRGVCESRQDGHPNYAYGSHISQHAAERIGERLIPFTKDFAKLTDGNRAL